MIVGLGLSAAIAQPIDKTEAQRLVDDLVPEVVQRAERAFLRPPTVGIETRERLYERLLEPPVEAMIDSLVTPGAPAPWRPPEEEVRRIDFMVANALAMYVGRDETIYVVKEAFEELSREFELGGDTLRPLLRCVLVHEMVHVLQHQYGVEDAATADQRRGLLAVREGHAEAVASDYCGEVEGKAIARLVDAIGHVELEASLTATSEAALYGWGRRLARSLQTEDLVWPAMVAPAPSWTSIVEAIEPTLPPAWRSGEPLQEMLEGLDDTIREFEGPVPASPTTQLLPFFQGRWGADAMPRARGGFVIEARTGRREMIALAFLLDQPGQADRLIERRLHSLKAARRERTPAMVYDRVSGMLARPIRARTIPTSPGMAVRITARSTGDGPYQEYWFATERRLLFLASTGRRLQESEILAGLQRLLEQLPAERGQPLALADLGDWAVRLRTIEPPRIPSWTYLFERSAKRVVEGDRGACSEHFDPFLRRGAVPDVVAYAGPAFACAAVAEDLPLAQRAHRLLPEVDPYAAVFWASRLANRHRPREALVMLAKADVARAGDRALALAETSVRTVAAVRLHDWATVSTLVEQHPELEPSLRAWAGSEMVRAGQRAGGRRLLAAACPSLAEPERGPCDRFLDER